MASCYQLECQWLSVEVKRGQKLIIPRRIIRASPEDTFGSLLEKLEIIDNEIVQRVTIQQSDTNSRQDASASILTHEVPLEAPVSQVGMN